MAWQGVNRCALARRPGYEDVHDACRRLRDIPLPHSGGLLPLVHRLRLPPPTGGGGATVNAGTRPEPGSSQLTLRTYRVDRNGRRVCRGCPSWKITRNAPSRQRSGSVPT
ncbi:hypothetical protein ACWGIA_16815 [Streptomyces bobili]